MSIVREEKSISTLEQVWKLLNWVWNNIWILYGSPFQVLIVNDQVFTITLFVELTMKFAVADPHSFEVGKRTDVRRCFL